MLFLFLGAALATHPTSAPGYVDGLSAPGILVSSSGEPLILEHSAYDVEVTAGLADVTLTQRYLNPFEETLDASYVFPMPTDAAVHDMSLICGKRVLRSTVMRKKDAKEAYDRARGEGRKAALIEQQRPNMFIQHVSGLCPGETVEVVLRYLEPIDERAGKASLVIPTTVGPRYDPGHHVEQPPFVPPTLPGRTLDVRVHVREAHIGGLWSDSHDITITEETSRSLELELTDAYAIPNRDVHLSWTLAHDELQASALFSPTDKGDGYLSVSILPQTLQAIRAPRSREVVLILDRSGSMGGASWTTATQAVLGVYDQLRPDDTFSIVGFSNQSTALFPEPVHPSSTVRDQVEAWLAPGPSGGTHMQGGLDMALSLPQTDRLRLALLISDGYIGDESTIFRTAAAHQDHARIFALGVGHAPNQHLLEGVAHHGRGAAFLQRGDQPASELAEDFIRMVATPAMTDITVSFEGMEVDSMHPSVLPDLWADRPLRFSGRARPGALPVVILRGRVDGRLVEERIPVDLQPGLDTLGALWARRYLREFDFRDTPDSEAIERATLVALDHGLVSTWTSRVAIDEQPNPCGPSQRAVDVPVHAPEGTLLHATGGLRGARGTAYGLGGLGTKGLGSGGGGFGKASGSFGASGTGRVSARTGTPIILGSLDASLVEQVVKRKMSQIRYCYQRELHKDPTLAGGITIKFTIGADGSVTQAVVKSTTLGNAAVERCVSSRFLSMAFPQPRGGGIAIVSYPLTFSPQE